MKSPTSLFRRIMLEEYHNLRGLSFDEVGYNTRFIKRYRLLLNHQLTGLSLLDIGAGNYGFVFACLGHGIRASGVDREINLESDPIALPDKCMDIVHVNAVIEHLSDPTNIMRESYRVLRDGGVIILNTPNWRLDPKNFYNDPTHKHPYTPEGLSFLVRMFGFTVILCEPALIVPSVNWWRVPFKWRVCSLIPKGSRSILLIGKKIVLTNGEGKA